MQASDSAATQFDVIIIGYGPVGATLANLLVMCGLSVLVLEREAKQYNLPRAVHIDDEVMRVMQSLGLASEVLRRARVNPGMRFVDADGQLLLDWPRPQEVGVNGWHASYRIHQPNLEDSLREANAALKNLSVRVRCHAYLIEAHANHVDVRYEELGTKAFSTVSAKYVIGCDGAKSIVRRFIGADMHDLGFEERWLVIDVILKTPKPELGDHSVQYCDPDRPATYVRSPGSRRRWEFSLQAGESNDLARSEAFVWDFLKPWLAPHEATLERTAVYTFRSLIAKKWRSDRLLIAGDAAHQTPPFMGQGLCAGIRDAANLAWKIALVIKRLAPDTLLDSYQKERYANAKEFIATAVKLGQLIVSPTPHETLNAAFPVADGSAAMKSILPRLGPGLSGGDSTLAGELCQQPTLANGDRLDARLGYGPGLLITETLWQGVEQSQREHCIALGIRCVSSHTEPSIAALLAHYNTQALIIRADRYILGCADNLDQLRQLLDATPASPIRPVAAKTQALTDDKTATSTEAETNHVLPNAAEFLYWPPHVQVWGYRMVDRLFAARTVKRGDKPTAMPRGQNLPVNEGGIGPLAELDQFMRDNVMAGLLVIKSGHIVLEQYGLNLQASDRWSTMSTVKSVTAMLVGAAVHDGSIASIDDPVSQYLPAYKNSAYDAVSVRHLLTMSSGTGWSEVYDDPASDVNTYSRCLAQRDPHTLHRLLADLPRKFEPGTEWQYNTGDSYLLGCLLSAATGRPIADYLSQKIWRTAGMEFDAFYTLDQEGGQEIGGSRAGMTLRDMGKFAQFVLDDGMIAGQRMLPEGWVKDALSPAFRFEQRHQDFGVIQSSNLGAYGYSWWLPKAGGAMAIGFAGQRIFVDIERNLAIVILSAHPQQRYEAQAPIDRDQQLRTLIQAIRDI